MACSKALSGACRERPGVSQARWTEPGSDFSVTPTGPVLLSTEAVPQQDFSGLNILTASTQAARTEQTHWPLQSNLCLGKSVGDLPRDCFSKVCFLPRLITMTPKPFPLCCWPLHSWGASETNCTKLGESKHSYPQIPHVLK